jgi:hypothetical protein
MWYAEPNTMTERSLSDRIANGVASFGAFLALLGLVSSVITFANYELRLLMWIDMWGSLVAWIIRAALIAGGIGLFFVAKIFDKSDSPEARAAAAEVHQRAWDAIKMHPRVQQFVADASQQLRISFEPSADPEVYVVRQFLWQDAGYRWTHGPNGPNYGPDDPQVTNVGVYLERASAPQRIVCSYDLATRRIVQQDAHPGTWAAVVSG